MNKHMKEIWQKIEKTKPSCETIQGLMSLLDKDEINECNDDGENILMLALEKGRYDLAILMMNLGVNPRKQTKSGKTTLHAATLSIKNHVSLEGLSDIIQRLVDNGVDILSLDGNYQTPLFNLFSGFGNKPSVSLLSMTYRWVDKISKQQQLDLSPCRPVVDYLFQRGEEGDAKMGMGHAKITKMRAAFKLWIYQLLGDTAGPALALNREEREALQQGRLGKLFKLTRLSINEDGKIIGSKGMIAIPSSLQSAGAASSSSHSPASSASSSSSSDASGASSSVSSSSAFPSVSVPHCNDVEAFRLALTAKNINSQSPQGESLLHCAVIKGNQAIVTLLLEQGCDKDLKNTYGYTPLHRAVMNNDIAIARLLLNAGADPICTDARGDTPLHWAAESGYGDMVTLLLSNHRAAEAKNTQNKDGHTPLYRAIVSGDLATVTHLLDAGADPNTPSKKQRTPLRLTFENGRKDIAELLLNAEAGMNDKPHDNGVTTLHIAIWASCTHIVKKLLDAGADPNIKARTKSSIVLTPLHAAIHTRNKEIAAYLLEAGADPNVQTIRCDPPDSGLTPLLLAWWYNDIEMIMLLLRYGANSHYDDDDRGPFYAASLFMNDPLCSEFAGMNDVQVEQLVTGLSNILEAPQSRSLNFGPGFFRPAPVHSSVSMPSSSLSQMPSNQSQSASSSSSSLLNGPT